MEFLYFRPYLFVVVYFVCVCAGALAVLRESLMLGLREKVSTVQIVEGDASTHPSTADILICANSRQKGLSTLCIHYLGCSLNLCTKKMAFLSQNQNGRFY